MADTSKTAESHLPVKGFLTVFIILLLIVAFSAAIAGENAKIKDTATRFMNRVAGAKYEDAYDLLSRNAKAKHNYEQFVAGAEMLRRYLRARYGVRFMEEYKFLPRGKVWFPWLTANTLPLSVGLYAKQPDVSSELKEFFSTPNIDGPELASLLDITRDKGQWRVESLNFNPVEHSDVLSKIPVNEASIFNSTENGFNLEGFVYDRRTSSPEYRDQIMEALQQAMGRLKKDAGIEEKPSDDLFKHIIP